MHQPDMNVCMVTCQHFLSGIGNYGYELSREMRKHLPSTSLLKPYRENHDDADIHKHSWIKPIQYRSFRNLHPYVMPLFVRKALNCSRDARTDIIHAHWFMSGLAATLAVKKPVVVTMHDVSLLHIGETGPRYLAYYKWVLKRFKKRRIPIIVVSKSAKLDAIKYADYPQELIFPVHNGINHARFNPGSGPGKSQNDRFRVIYSGGLGPRKNVGLLLEAFKQVQQRIPDIELHIAGASPARTPWPQRAHDLGLTHVTFTGFIADEDMADFYRNGDLLVFPSRYEGFGFAPLEAMACGTPVLSARGGALTETSGNGADFFEYDVDDLADKMERLIQDGERRQQLTDRGTEWVKRYSWRATAINTLSVYRRLLK